MTCHGSFIQPRAEPGGHLRLLARVERIRPVKAAAGSGLTVAFHCDHLAEILDAEWGEGQDLDFGVAVDPDHTVFRLHCDGEIMEPIDGLAQARGKM